jgi:hypothetical protein
MAINLHIERLVLDGLPITRHQGGQIQAAIETELARLLSTPGFASQLNSGYAVPAMKANPINLSPQSDVEQMGSQIAQSVYHSINGY